MDEVTPEARVFRVNRDTSDSCSLLYDLPGDQVGGPLVDFYGDSRQAVWPTPRVVPVVNDHASAHDVWWLRQARLSAIASNVVDRLEPFVSMCGELLPLDGDFSTQVHALNVLSVVDALDRRDQEPLVLRPSFIVHRLGEPTVFMVPQLIGMLFCVEWGHIEDSFKRRVETHGVTGLGFEPVWSSTQGACDINLLYGS